MQEGSQHLMCCKSFIWLVTDTLNYVAGNITELIPARLPMPCHPSLSLQERLQVLCLPVEAHHRLGLGL